MSEAQFTVEDVFTIRGRGVVLHGLPIEQYNLFKVGDKVTIRRPDGSLLQSVIRGIESVQSEVHIRRMLSQNGIVFTRGKLIRVHFDESRFVGGGVYLFASVLDRFLARYASMNSFTQIIATSKQRGNKEVGNWPARAGQRALI